MPDGSRSLQERSSEIAIALSSARTLPLRGHALSGCMPRTQDTDKDVDKGGRRDAEGDKARQRRRGTQATEEARQRKRQRALTETCQDKDKDGSEDKDDREDNGSGYDARPERP